MAQDNSLQLTDDEARLYDRQIRLWGVESQKRLRNAKLLIISLNGLGAEVAKNIILSGVKSVTFMDNVSASEVDSFSQFLIPVDKVGSNRAVASVDRAKELNPLVAVSAITMKADALKEEEIKNYDVIIAIEQNSDTLIRLNSVCRENKIQFFAADVFGMFGYFFSDLQEHEYIMQIPRLDNDGKPLEKQKRTEIYTSFQEAFEFDFRIADNKPLLHRMEPSFFLFRILMKFRDEHERYPDQSEEDFNVLSNIRKTELADLPYDQNKLDDQLLSSCLGCPVSPSCAIVGAMVAQEVIKAVSHRDYPNKNMFFFNPRTNVGHFQYISA